MRPLLALLLLVCLSLPAVIGRNGIERIIQPELNADEQQAFREAAETVRSVIEAVS